MAGTSKIEWTGHTWNPIVGCSVVSPGCTNCYAMKMAARLEAMATKPDGKGNPYLVHYEGLTRDSRAGAVWTGKVRSAGEDALLAPLRRRKPTTYFVNSMSDLFHKGVTDEQIDRVFAVMALCPQHTFQVLTKRSARMHEYLTRPSGGGKPDALNRIAWDAAVEVMNKVAPGWTGEPVDGIWRRRAIRAGTEWPLPNVWLGVSAEDQQRADERVPDLLATPAAVRFVSAEPLLGPIDFTAVRSPAAKLDALDGFPRGRAASRLDWIIVGGESGPKARHLWTPNVRSIVRQCAEASVACFVKQLGADIRDRNDAGFEGCEPHEWPDVDPADVEHDLDGTSDGYQGASVRIRLRSRKGNDPSEWPADLRVRQLPGAHRDEAPRSRP